MCQSLSWNKLDTYKDDLKKELTIFAKRSDGKHFRASINFKDGESAIDVIKRVLTLIHNLEKLRLPSPLDVIKPKQ